MERKVKLAMLGALTGNSIFGFSFMFSRMALGITSPFVMLMVRFILAAAMLGVIALIASRKGDWRDENGEIHDDFRVEYIHDHLVQVREAIGDGCEVFGYLYWGPMDIVSAGTGEMKKRYGFVYVDRHNDGTGTLKRSLKDSYDWFKKVIESNGEEL
jgi:hypothetical protein